MFTFRMPAPASDAADVVLLIPGNGSHGTTTFTDQSSYGRTLTTNGAVIVSTAQAKFGPGSILFDKTSESWLKAEYTAATALGSGDFTMEVWVYCLDNFIQGIFTTGNGLSASGISVNRDFDGTRLALRVAGTRVIVSGVGTFGINLWHFVSLQRSGNTLSLYLNGSLVGTHTFALSLAAVSLYLGAEVGLEPATSGDGNWFRGHIEQFRVTRGLARGASVPTGPF